jgi:2-polyprenyl-3-methyl-5-hydroxy-6-metoxy-1,4-benzoquinol methylase
MKCSLCGKNTNYLLAKTLRGDYKGKVFFCDSCELGMLENVKSEKEISDFYKKEYRSHVLYKESSGPKELFDLYSQFQDNRIGLLKKYINNKTELLEVGCSVGMFLYHVKKYTKRIAGIDYDIASGKFASDKCKCLVFDKDIKKTGLSKESFDIICMFQVLEHVENPVKFISEYKEYLKPGGLICVEVPNIRDVLRYAYDLPNYNKFYFHPAHLWYFSEKSLAKVMKKADFSGKVVFSQNYNIVNHFHWIDTDKPQGSCVPGLSDPFFPIKNEFNLKKGRELNRFILDIDFFYKELLKKLKITDNITFIGRKNG